MAAKRFLSLFKSSNKREKENNDPLMSEYQYHLNNGQRRSRRVNFRSADVSSKRRSCATEVTNDDDDGSEVTLTATEASRQQLSNSKKMPPNPYLVVTEPKRNHGPRSCPGGGGQHYFDFDSLDNDDISGANGGTLDRSLEARSEFISNTQQQHRRSSRHRLLPSDEKTSQSSHPFSEIGNGRGKEGQQRENGVNFGNSSRYKNIPWAAADFNSWRLEGSLGGKQQYIIRIREQQQEINDLQIAYRDERARRKAYQRDLRREQEAKDRFQCENFRLQSIIGLLVQQQQQPNSGNLNAQLGIDLNNLAAIMPNNLYNSWTGNTPSSSSAVAAPPIHPPLQPPPPQSLLQPQSSNPWTPCRFIGNFQQQQLASHSLFGNVGGPGECLAAPILSSSSLISQQTKQHQKINQQNSEDEIKIFRTGQNNTDSFSGSSRLTTGDLTEMEREKNDLLVSDVSSKEFCSSPEVERGGGNTTTLHGLSFSVDDCQNLFSLNRKNVGGGEGKDNSFPILFPDVELPLRDDGYATSETNMSASGIANSECTTNTVNDGGGEGESISSSNLLIGNSNNVFKTRRRSKSTGQLTTTF
uniref:Uncharacterized protein n=1 Tax=Meloidogyne incognita TaxID=6306 RepID=A0A914L8Y9_MELIC